MSLVLDYTKLATATPQHICRWDLLLSRTVFFQGGSEKKVQTGLVMLAAHEYTYYVLSHRRLGNRRNTRPVGHELLLASQNLGVICCTSSTSTVSSLAALRHYTVRDSERDRCSMLLT